MSLSTSQSQEDPKAGGIVIPSESLIARYELLRRLGRGGMAEVWLARAIGLRDFEKLLVLKRILRDKREDPRFIGMLRDEARVAATLDHPNVVTTIDVGVEGDELFIAMEYLHGQDVKSMLIAAHKAGESMPLELAAQIAMGCAAGLHHAHEQTDSKGRPLNIVHRDVSPSNVIVTHHSGVKLIDFGIATAQSRREQTAVGMLKGKAAYMSPEQCRGKTLDRRSDLFALGILIYEMTAMVRPFEGESHLAVMHQICNENPRPPSKVRRDYPEGLERVVMRALEKDPDKRHQTAFALLEELERVTRDSTLHALPGALARYLEHLFGPQPHPWQADGGLASREGRDLDTTQTGAKEPKPNTSTITQPNVGKKPDAAPPTRTEAPADPKTGARVAAAPLGRTAADRAMVTERALRLLDEDEVALAPATVRSGRSGAAIVAGAVLLASAIVMVAAMLSSPAPPTPREAAAVRPIAQPTEAAPSASIASVADSPEVPPPAPAPQPPASAIEPEVEVPDAVADVAPAPSRRADADAEKKEAARRVSEAARLLQEARSQLLKSPTLAMTLTRKSLALKRTTDGYALLGLLGCKVGDKTAAKQAYPKLSVQQQADLQKTCAAQGIEL